MILTTQPDDYLDIDLQEVISIYDQATTATRHSRLAKTWLHTPTGRKIANALNLIPILATQVGRLRERLTRALTDLGNLTAAARATLGAQRDGETDPLYYLRDELQAQGQLPPDEQERP
ncbi:MAG TPA: hypothetical protein VN969_10850 [Streptosporangiaceae bacterium]|nr:hypothetical protein [Streptosporangiaceae bacterium]